MFSAALPLLLLPKGNKISVQLLSCHAVGDFSALQATRSRKGADCKRFKARIARDSRPRIARDSRPGFKAPNCKRFKAKIARDSRPGSQEIQSPDCKRFKTRILQLLKIGELDIEEHVPVYCLSCVWVVAVLTLMRLAWNTNLRVDPSEKNVVGKSTTRTFRKHAECTCCVHSDR
jgi:hypothetical protein